MTDVNIVTEVKTHLLGLADAIRKYDQLSENDQKSVRHLLYKQTGKYGKAVTKEIFPILRGLNREFDQRKKDQS